MAESMHFSIEKLLQFPSFLSPPLPTMIISTIVNVKRNETEMEWIPRFKNLT